MTATQHAQLNQFDQVTEPAGEHASALPLDYPQAVPGKKEGPIHFVMRSQVRERGASEE